MTRFHVYLTGNGRGLQRCHPEVALVQTGGGNVTEREMSEISPEGAEVLSRYERRASRGVGDRYSPMRSDVLGIIHERERALRRWFVSSGLRSPEETTVFEVGCGAGGWLQSFLRLGFCPANLSGIDLIADDVSRARDALPVGVRLKVADAVMYSSSGETYDVVTQATAFSSILDRKVRGQVADSMWNMARAGGGVRSFDFAYSNPRNPDVEGVSVGDIRKLFPDAVDVRVWRLVLAPPISRRVEPLGSTAYAILRLPPFLRTHRLIWLPKR